MEERLNPHPVDGIAAIVAPELKRLGFKKSGFNWHKDGTESVQVLAVHRSRWGGAGLEVEVGASFKHISDSAKSPIHKCHVRAQMFTSMDRQVSADLRKEINRLDLIHSRGVSAGDPKERFQWLLEVGHVQVDPSEWQTLSSEVSGLILETMVPLLLKMSTTDGLRRLKAEDPNAGPHSFEGVFVSFPLSREID